MRRSRRFTPVLVLTAVMALALGATSCGGGGSGGDPDLVLVGFNVPNIAGIPLNQPLIFTFSNAIDPGTITPDTLRVVGAFGPNFELTVVDGNLVGLLPRSPNFEDYSDAGLLPAVVYTVDLAVFPAPSTITTPNGKPLLDAEGFQFTTVPFPTFVEPRRPITHGLAPSQGGRSDDEGCLQNPDNSLFDGTVQFGSGIGARLLCLKNEGPPRVILDQCEPTHADQAVGTPSAVTPGTVNLPALRIRLNEPLDPVTVVPYVPTSKLGINCQLWRVGGVDKVPVPPEPTRINKPLIVQSLDLTEIILVAANEDEFGDPVGGVPKGTYLINITGAVTDLPGNGLVTSDSPPPVVGGYAGIAQAVDASGDVPGGYRIYFTTLDVPGTPQSFNESFSTNVREWGDAVSFDTEPGVFTRSNTLTGALLEQIPAALLPQPEYSLEYSDFGIGQSTSANWNNGFRFLGLDSLPVNTDEDPGTDRLKAIFRPFVGGGHDGVFNSGGLGSVVGRITSPVPGASVNGDGIYEYESFWLQAPDTLRVTGTQPLVILCRGEFRLDGTVVFASSKGGPGLDTDGSELYTQPTSASAAGLGGDPAAGGGRGGAGGDPFLVFNVGGQGSLGGRGSTLFGLDFTDGGGGGLGGASPDQQGGGGGGFGGFGGGGFDAAGVDAANGGSPAGTLTFGKDLADFEPDRGYSPNSQGAGGTGGGGGGVEDTNSDGNVNNGDAGGGGGGGGGGCLYVLCGGEVIVTGSILCNGAEGGDTFAFADQVVNLGADGLPGGTGEDADFVEGVTPGATPSGAGGPGGGGAGGGVFLMGAEGVRVLATATISAVGGDGGESGDPDLEGGAGGDGKVVFAVLETTPDAPDIDGGASIDPLGYSLLTYKPTVDLNSAGQSEWYDMFTGSAVFDPPVSVTNFTDLFAVGLVQGVHYDAELEFQGADNVAPLPTDGTPTVGVGLTAWIPYDPDIAWPVNMKRYIRWRWRFRLEGDYPVATEELPAILDLTIPFIR